MNILKVGLVTAFAVVFSSAIAAPRLLGGPMRPVAQGIYIGVTAGYSDLNIDKLGTTETGQKQADWAAGIFGGYQFNHHWAAEMGFNYLPEYKSKISGVSKNVRPNQTYAAMKGRILFQNHVNVFAKLGTAYNYEMPQRIKDGDYDSDNLWRPYGALGLGYLATENVDVTAQISATTDHLWYASVGVSYIIPAAFF